MINIINTENTAKLTKNIDIFFGYYYNEMLKSSLNSQFSLCKEGYYLSQGGEDHCLKCLNHAICKGGYHPIYP